MDCSRREFGKIALATVPGIALLEKSLVGSSLAQARPNSLINGVQIGTITYSFRSMPDQSAEATLRYILQSGISAVELMGAVAESYAGAPSGRAGGPGAAAAPAGGGGGGRAAGGAPAPTVAADGTLPVCGPAAAETPGGAARQGGGGGRGAASPEQLEAQAALKKWRTSVSMDRFKALRKMYNDAGVSIYAWKTLNPNMSDEEMDYVFNVAAALGCTHTTLELPTDPAALKRIGQFAEKHKIYAAYHTHLQGNMTAFDAAFAASKGNMANVDLGHYVAAGSGDPVQFLTKFHDRIASFHLKDRTTPAHCALNLPWGTGETPIKNILQTARKNGYKMPASIELEYAIPAGSDAVRETTKCVQFCRAALA